MPFIDFSVLQRNNSFQSQPGDIYLRSECLIGVWVLKNYVYLNFGSATLEIHFNPKDKDSENDVKLFAKDIMSGNTDLSSYAPKIFKCGFASNSMVK